MKLKLITIYTLFFICFIGSAQEKEFMKSIAMESCECVKKVDKNLKEDEFFVKLGLCMIEVSKPYAKELKKEYNLDIYNMNQMERLGEVVGVEMLTYCPDALMMIAQETGTLDEELEQYKTIYGEIVKIDEGEFVRIDLKDGTGKRNKFIWFTYIESDLDLIDSYKTLVGKSVDINYVEKEIFDPRINEYRKVNMITGLFFN